MLIQKDVYTDIPMFITRNSFSGDISVKKDQNAIQESVKNTILTVIGERPFERTFGSNVYNYLFENVNRLEFYADDTIRSAIDQNEPRIRIDDIIYDYEEKSVKMTVKYFILKLNLNQTLSVELQRTR